MQNRIQDLQRQQLLAQTALAQQTRSLGVAAHDAAESQQPGAGGSSEQRPEEDPIQAERKRRAYVSLFSSNVALSYRKPPANATAPVTEYSDCRPGSAPFGSRRITDPPTLERDAVQFDFPRASPQRFRGNNA